MELAVTEPPLITNAVANVLQYVAIWKKVSIVFSSQRDLALSNTVV